MRLVIFGKSGSTMTVTDVQSFLLTEEVDGEECLQFAFKQEGDDFNWHDINEPDKLRKLVESISGIKIIDKEKEDAATDPTQERKEE